MCVYVYMYDCMRRVCIDIRCRCLKDPEVEKRSLEVNQLPLLTIVKDVTQYILSL